MQRSYLLSSAVLGLAMGAQAQFFVELHGNYLLPIGGYGMQSSTNDLVNSELLNFGCGAGGGLALGTALNDVLGVEARFSYVSGTEQQFDQSSSDPYQTSSTTGTWKTTYLRFEPALRATVGEGALRGYLAVGPSLAFGPKLTYDGDDHNSHTDPLYPEYSYTSDYTTTEEYKGGIGWGGFAALGFTWNSGGAVGFFAEVQATAQDWAPKESKSTYKDTFQSAGYPPESHSDSYTTEYVDSFGPEDEERSTKLHLPMSTWGARAGVRFTFGGGAGKQMP